MDLPHHLPGPLNIIRHTPSPKSSHQTSQIKSVTPIPRHRTSSPLTTSTSKGPLKSGIISNYVPPTRRKEKIIKISETRSGFHSQDRTSMCIYIHRRTLEKLLSACIRALNLVLVPINDENDTEYTCFDSKTVADEEAELNYVIDIAKPTPKSKNTRMIHIFMETMFNDIIVGSITSSTSSPTNSKCFYKHPDFRPPFTNGTRRKKTFH